MSFEIDDAAARAFGDHRVVEHAKTARLAFFALDPDFQRHALFDFVIPLQGLRQHPLQLVHRHLGDKAQAAQIHAENRHIGPFHQRRDVEQRAVAAQRNDEVGLRRHLFLGTGLRRAAHQAVFYQNFLAPPLKPGNQPAGHLRGFGFLVLGN